MVRMMFVVSATVLAGIGQVPARAYDASGQAKVAVVEVTYMPRVVQFQLASAVGGCPAGDWIYWYPQGDTQSSRDQNAQAVLSTLVTAKVSGQPIRVFLASQGCKAEYLYLG